MEGLGAFFKQLYLKRCQRVCQLRIASRRPSTKYLILPSRGCNTTMGLQCCRVLRGHLEMPRLPKLSTRGNCRDNPSFESIRPGGRAVARSHQPHRSMTPFHRSCIARLLWGCSQPARIGCELLTQKPQTMVADYLMESSSHSGIADFMNTHEQSSLKLTI